MIFRCGVGSQTSITASHTSRAYSSSVPVKLSGEYSRLISVPHFSASLRTSSAPRTAIVLISARFMWNTTRRCSSEVEL